MTHEQIISLIARRWNTQYNYTAEYLSRGFTPEQIAEGNRRGEADLEQWLKWKGQYGSPEYGGWATDPADGMRKPVQEFKEGEI